MSDKETPFEPQRIAAVRKEAAEWRRNDNLLKLCAQIDALNEADLRQVEIRIAIARVKFKPEHLDL